MVEPVQVGNFLLVFASAAAIVVFGAAYAGLYALSRVRNLPILLGVAYFAYAALVAAAAGLAYAANLYTRPVWAALCAVMLLGYLFAPRAIFHLCRGVSPRRLE